MISGPNRALVNTLSSLSVSAMRSLCPSREITPALSTPRMYP